MKKIKNNKTVKIIVFIILFILISPLIVNWIINTPNPFGVGFVTEENKDTWINFFGAIIGGGATLFGVWWTIKDQEDKRREDLSIPFKPVITLTSYKDGDMHQNNPYRDINLNHEDEKHVLPICFKLKNDGSGKAFNLSYSNAYIKFSNPLPIEAQLDISGPIVGSLDVDQEMTIKFKFTNTDMTQFENTEFTIIFTLNYTDIFGYRNRTDFEYKASFFFDDAGFTYFENYGEILSTVKFNSTDKNLEIPLKGGSLTTIPKK